MDEMEELSIPPFRSKSKFDSKDSSNTWDKSGLAMVVSVICLHNFQYFFLKSCVVRIFLNCRAKAILMDTNNCIEN